MQKHGCMYKVKSVIKVFMQLTCKLWNERKAEKGRLALDWMLYIGGADLICMTWQDLTEMWLPFLCFQCQCFALSIRFSFVACPSSVKKCKFPDMAVVLRRCNCWSLHWFYYKYHSSQFAWHFHGWYNQAERLFVER